MFDVEDELVRLAVGNPGMIQLTPPSTRAFYPPVVGGAGQEVRLTDAEQDEVAARERGEVLKLSVAAAARERGLTPGQLDDMLTEFSGGFRDDESKAWALFTLDELRVGEQVINLAGECVQLADAKGGDGPGVRAGVRRTTVGMSSDHAINSQQIRAAWSALHHPKNAGKYSPAVRDTIKAKLRALARQRGVPLEDPDDDMGNVPGAENQGNQGPKPRPGKKRTRPDQVPRRGQHPFFGEGGSPDGGSGPSGGEMAASAGYMKLAQDAADGDPAAIAMVMHDSANYRAVVGPFESGTTRNVEKHYPFEVHEVDRDDTEHDDRTTDEIARLLAVADNVLGRDKPYGANTTHRPKTIGQRRLEQARATTRPENLIMR